jgi:hypothetical protein
MQGRRANTQTKNITRVEFMAIALCAFPLIKKSGKHVLIVSGGT